MMDNFRDYSDEWRIVHLERLGLNEDPFKASADPRFLYLGPEHLSVFRQLQGVIARRRGLALVTGSMGMGKSTLARRLFDLHYEDEKTEIAYIDTASFRTPMDAARGISRTLVGLNVPPARSYAAQKDILKEAIVKSYQANVNTVLLLDDAQRMSREALEVIHELYNFDYDDKLIQVILFGQNELTPLFASYPAVNSRVFVQMSLPPLTMSSALQMINFRLRTAGRTAPLIDDNAFAMLFNASGGVPREIVRLCALATDLLIQSEYDFVTQDVMAQVLAAYGH
jgi:type II secretory pathway predicted ATPase ExeA